MKIDGPISHRKNYLFAWISKENYVILFYQNSSKITFEGINRNEGEQILLYTVSEEIYWISWSRQSTSHYILCHICNIFNRLLNYFSFGLVNHIYSCLYNFIVDTYTVCSVWWYIGLRIIIKQIGFVYDYKTIFWHINFARWVIGLYWLSRIIIIITIKWFILFRK